MIKQLYCHATAPSKTFAKLAILRPIMSKAILLSKIFMSIDEHL